MTDRVTITPQRKRGDLNGLLGIETLHVQFVREPADTPAVYRVDRDSGRVSRTSGSSAATTS